MLAHELPAEPPNVAAELGRVTYPCSQSQLRFWVEEQLSPQNPALNIAVRWRLEGTLAHCVLEEAWLRIVNRHDPLRTSFFADDEEPVQYVEPTLPFSIPAIDLRDLSEPARSTEADRLAEREARLPFDITTAPLIRVTRLIVADTATILLVTAHHTICDGWSIGILAREMGQICAALEDGVQPFLPELGLTYGEFAAWENQQIATGSLDNECAYVRELLRDHKQFELLPDRPRPRRLSSNGAIASLLLDRELTDSLAKLARDNGCTLFMTALSALFTLLQRYTGETDIVLGTQVVGRDDEELENLVGCFINTIALRGDLSGDPDFITVLERTRDMVSDAFDARSLPLQRLIEIAKPVRDLSRNALFSINFIYQRSFITNAVYGDFSLVDLPSRSAGALFDLNFFMVERPEGWRLSCEYNTDLFEPQTVTGLLDRFLNVLSSVAANPAQAIAQIPILTADDEFALVVAANRTQYAYPAERTLPQLFAEQVARTPSAPAVVCDGVTLSYAQLAAATQRMARVLAQHGCRPGLRIGILLERSVEMVVAMLAALSAGCTYVPLDPTYPPERLAFIAADSKLALTVTHSTLAARLDFKSSPRILVDDSSVSDLSRATLPDMHPAPNDVAYIIYTSGSTGSPKGVQIQHKALLNLLWTMREQPGISASDTLVAVTTISFDMAVLEIFLPLIAGAKVVIARDADIRDAHALLELVQRTRATIMQATPVTWQLLINAGWRGDPALKMLCGGEPLARTLAEQLLERSPELWNLYGPTETTVYSAGARVTSGSGPVLIGPPIANTQLYVLDAHGSLVPSGVAGELHIGGDGVALGYLDRDELSRERFIADPFSAVPGARMYRSGDIVRRRSGGSFEFLGRSDHQIKLRGFRIELGEIAAALLRQSGVADAVAIAVTDAADDPAIRAYVVAQPDSAPDSDTWAAELRAQIAEILPNYMLPATIAVLERLPRLPNGKIDRAALPRLSTTGPAIVHEPPATPTEITLAALVSELLERERVGRHDDLFDLGFHSLTAVRLTARIANIFDVRLPLRSVFDDPTVAGIARNIDTPSAAVAAPMGIPAQPIVVYNAGGSAQPFVFFHSDSDTDGMYCRRLAVALGPTQPLIAIAPHGSAGLPVLTSIEAMARDYLPRLKALQPAGPYQLGGHCAGGVIAFELARLLRAQGETVGEIVIVNAFAPARFALPGNDALQRRIGLDRTLDSRVREVICANIARLALCVDKGPAALVRYVRARLSTALRLRERQREHDRKYPDIPERPRGAHVTEALFAYMVAGFTYHPKRDIGNITLIWSDDEEPAMGDPTAGDPTMGWAALATNVRVVSIAGGHNSPIQERVADLGAIVTDCLPQAKASFSQNTGTIA